MVFLKNHLERIEKDTVQSLKSKKRLQESTNRASERVPFPTSHLQLALAHARNSRVKNEILLNMNKQHVTLLVLLDLSAAFDTTDHCILPERLKSGFGIRGTALSWFASYLNNRSQQILIDGSLSMNFELSCGVPQGSCLGSLLFVLYASKIFQIVDKHLPGIHCYAEDNQLYLFFCPNASVNHEVALARMESCIDDIRNWMLNDKLKLTPLLMELHWLPIELRIEFKIILIVFKIFKGLAPSYLSSLITRKPESRYNLRNSCDKTLLSYPSFKSKATIGDRAFIFAAPKLWNNLPRDIRESSSINSFKSKLKTFLFKK